MKKLTMGLAASLLALGASACDRQPGAGGGNAGPNAAPVQAPNGDWSKAISQTNEGGILMGNPNAQVRVVEFASMTCGFCANFAIQDKPKLVEKVKTGNVAFEFRNYVRDPIDITASLIARCAGATPQFFALTDGMFADQKAIFDRIGAVPQDRLASIQSLPPGQQFQQLAQLTGLQEWAAQRGLPSSKTSQCLANQAEIDRLVQMVSDSTTQYNIQGTPTFLINNEVMELQPGTPTWQQLETAINEALS